MEEASQKAVIVTISPIIYAYNGSKRLEKAMATKDGDVQVISALAGNALAGAYENVIERISRRGHNFPKSSELRALLVGVSDEH